MADDFNVNPFDFSFLRPKKEKVPDFSAESDLIKSELKGTIASGGMSDFLQQRLLSGTKKIGQQAGTTREAVREAGASAGFKGANVNVLQDIFATEAGAVGELEAGVGAVASQRESEALGRLIGVNQFDVTNAEQKRQFEKMFGLKEKELDAMIDAQGGDFMSVIGGVLGAGVGIVSGGAFGGLATGVGDIFEDFFA